LTAGALVAGSRLSSGATSPPGIVTVSRALPGDHGTLSLTAQWASGGRQGHMIALGGLSAQFSTCHRGWFLDLKQYCVALANPFFKVLGVTPRGGTVFRLTTNMVQDNDAHAHRTSWIIPIDQRTGALYRLSARNDLIVQLWAIDTATATLYELGEIRG
jgi:hypothetical protein